MGRIRPRGHDRLRGAGGEARREPFLEPARAVRHPRPSRSAAAGQPGPRGRPRGRPVEGRPDGAPPRPGGPRGTGAPPPTPARPAPAPPATRAAPRPTRRARRCAAEPAGTSVVSTATARTGSQKKRAGQRGPRRRASRADAAVNSATTAGNPASASHGEPGPHRAGRRERRRDAAAPQVAALRADHAHRGVEVAQLASGQPRHPAAAGRGREHPARGHEHQQRHDPAGQQPRSGEHHRLGRPVARPDPAPPQGDRRGAGRGYEPHRHAEQRHRPRPSARADRVRGHAVQPAEQSGDQRGERLHSCPPPAVAPSRWPQAGAADTGPAGPVFPLWHHACGGRQRRSPPTRSGPSRDDRPSPRSSTGSTAPLPGCGAVGWSWP